MTDHNPAFPDRRRYLARVVLLAGTALHLDLPDAVAVQAERDAATLRACHAARSVLHLCPDRLRAREADTHLSILESWARDPQVPPFASAAMLVDLANMDETHLVTWERGMLHASEAAGRVVCGPWALALGYADTAHTEACAAYARATDPSGRRYAALVAEHARRLANELTPCAGVGEPKP